MDMRKLLLIAFFLAWTGLIKAQSGCQCSSYNAANKTAAEGLRLTQIPDEVCRTKGYEIIAEILLNDKNFDSVTIVLDKALSAYKKTKCAETYAIPIYKLYAALNENKADFQSSLTYNLKALTLAEQLNDPLDKGTILLNIAQVFNRLKQADKGILYTRLAVPVVNNLPASDTKAELLNKITARYFYYAQDFKSTPHTDTAENFVTRALSVAQQIGNIKEQIIALTRLNAIYESRKEYTKALRYIDEALKMCVPGIHNRQYTTLYGDKGHMLMNLGNYREARRFADSCLYYCIQTKYPPIIANAYSLIYEIENKAGNFKEALLAMQNEKQITDSIATAERTKAVVELEKKYNQARNEKTIQELAQQKKIYLLLAIAGLFGLFAIGFFLRQQALKHKQKIMETEQRLNRARMNPHFFFNALASLQSFAIRENDGEAIASNLSKFSHIMRETLESTYKEYVTVEQEIDFLNEYLDVQKIRFPRKFDYEVIAANDLEADELQLPAMIIQPFVENSIEHGFSNIDYTGLVTIEFNKSEKDLRISITDNGKGLITNTKEHLPAGQAGNEHISRASQIIKDRIYLLNVKLKTKASFSIDNNPAGKGVQVIINLPLIYIK